MYLYHLQLVLCFSLALGTLYPAYASYKAVRTKDVKEYVRLFHIFFYFESVYYPFH